MFLSHKSKPTTLLFKWQSLQLFATGQLMTNAMQGLLHSVLSKKRLMPTHSIEVLASGVNSVTKCNEIIYTTPSHCIITVWKTFFSLTLPLGVTLLFKQQWQQSLKDLRGLDLTISPTLTVANPTRLRSHQSISFKMWWTTWAIPDSNTDFTPCPTRQGFLLPLAVGGDAEWDS